MGCHHSHWLSYFSRWFKPPTSTNQISFLGATQFRPIPNVWDFFYKNIPSERSGAGNKCQSIFRFMFGYLTLHQLIILAHTHSFSTHCTQYVIIVISYTIIAPWDQKKIQKHVEKRHQMPFFFGALGQTEFRLMLQRYMGARMTIPVPVGAPFGAVVFTCHSWCGNDGEDPVPLMGWKDLGFRFRQPKIGKPTSLLGYKARYNGDTMGVPRNILQAVAQ